MRNLLTCTNIEALNTDYLHTSIEDSLLRSPNKVHVDGCGKFNVCEVVGNNK